MPAANAAAGHDDRPGPDEVVTARAVIDVRRAAHLAHPDDQRVGEEIALLQILKQARPGGIEHVHVRLVNDEVVGMAVVIFLPNLDERHAGLDELARHETAAPEIGVAIAFLSARPFALNIEYLPGAHEPKRALLGQPMRFIRLRPMIPGSLLFHEVQQIAAAILSRRRQRRHREVRKLPIAANGERLIARPEVAGAGIARRAHAHEARQIRFRIAQILGDHRANLRVRHPLILLVASVHVIDAIGMIRRLRAHAANDRELVHLPRHPRQIFAHLNAVDIRLNRPERSASGPTRLHIEGIDLARAAIRPQEDAAFILARGLLRDGLRAEEPAPVGDRHPASGGERRLEEGAAADVLVSCI